MGRAVAGLGAGGLSSGAFTIIAVAAPPGQAAVYTGLLGATYGITSLANPLVGGLFTEYVSWRWFFYVNLPIDGVSAAIIFLIFRDPQAAKSVEANWHEKILRIDLPGAFITMAVVVCYLLPLQWGGTTKK